MQNGLLPVKFAKSWKFQILKNQVPKIYASPRKKGRKEGKKGKKGKTDRKKVRERKGKEKRVNKLWQTFLIFIFVIFVCYWAKNNPTFLSQTTENLVFKILKKTYLYSGLGPKRQTKTRLTTQKTITFTPASIIGHVQNARKSFHFFFFLGVVFFFVFFALANLTT